ncbi:hypothetical protein [Rhodospirillum sp. A1_3_36]|uniref:hypothetical protein n=1 Tax=Rhodospirillum sp. A1_3_36 TaxID=3391666 RepID=UPI0039A529C3
MDNDSIREVRTFLSKLVDYPFLLKRIGIEDVEGANYFVNSNQEEEFVYEAFLLGLVHQTAFYPSDPNLWLSMARKCNFDHPAILDENIDITEGGPLVDWYIYPKLVQWLVKNSPDGRKLNLNKIDKCFLYFKIPDFYDS